MLCDTKWQLFNKRTWLFRHIPFTTGVFGSGSLALGNVNENSDFDVLILAKTGRIFSARFFSAVAFSIFGWRRKKLDHRISAKDKVCLNHFVTSASYHLTLPPSVYWQALYKQLVPLYGTEEKINEFFKANADWLGDIKYQADLRHKSKVPSRFKIAIEFLLAGLFGDWLESILKKYQVSRIKRGLPADYKDPMSVKSDTRHLPPLIRYSDTELEFHPDPAEVVY